MDQRGWRGSSVQEDEEAISTQSDSTSEEESENVEGEGCEETTEEEEEEESPPYSPLSSPKYTTPTLSPEKTVASACKRPPPQLIPISELNSSQTPADPNKTPSTSSTGSEAQRRTRRWPVLTKVHAVDETKLHLGYFCVCSTRFSQLSYLTQHIRIFSRERKFSCKWCPGKYTHLATLRRHVVKTHHKNPFMAQARGCSECGTVFKNLEELKAHRLANHPQWTEKLKSIPHAVDETVAAEGHFRCVCGKEYAKQEYLIIHVQNYNNPANFQCETCLSSFKNHGQLLAHCKKIHKMPAKDGNRFGCTLCARLFQNRKEIRQHMEREHHVIFKNHADKLTNPSKRSREHGIAPRAPEEQEDVFRCLCGSGHPSKFRLLTHIRNSQAQVTFKCPHCQGEFAVHAKLARHIRKVHQVDYVAFGCHLCGVIFKSQCLLMQHQHRAHGVNRH